MNVKINNGTTYNGINRRNVTFHTSVSTRISTMNERLQTTSCFRKIIFQQLCLQEATDLVPFINRLIDLFRTCADRINATVTTFDSQRSSLPKQRTIRRQTNCFLAPFLQRRQRRKTIETKKKKRKKRRRKKPSQRASWILENYFFTSRSRSFPLWFESLRNFPRHVNSARKLLEKSFQPRRGQVPN